MNIGMQIKNRRAQMNISQEELAQRVFVTRQTVSNWETEKSYPDIHSVLLLSQVFGTTVDALLKEDIAQMKSEINQNEIKRFNKYSGIFSVLLIITILLTAPLIVLLSVEGMVPLKAAGVIVIVLLWAVTMAFAFKVEKIKKDNNISTYKEIVAFTEGKTLDEITTQREIGKRPYQRLVAALIGAGVGAVIAAIGIFISEIIS